MTEQGIRDVALQLLPRLEAYYLAHRQARWQQRAAAGANKLAWQAVLLQVDNKIATLENAVKFSLDLGAYKGKRVFEK